MEKKTLKKKLVLKRKVRNFISRTLITVIIVLIALIVVKNNPSFKNIIIENVYEKSFKFTKAKKFYQKYFGDILTLDSISKEEQAVFSEKLNYEKVEKYNNGVALTVNKNYMVPILESGVVVFMGEKEGYGSTVVVEQIDGITVSYGNISTNNLKLYDYIEKGNLLGEANDEKLYLIFQKDGKFLDYKKYI